MLDWAGMDTPAPVSKTYDLQFLLDNQGWYWSNPNRGVTITDDGPDSSMTWQAEGGSGKGLWTDIVSVTMRAATAGRGAVNHCRIQFRDGSAFTVTNAGADGTLDESRIPIYRDFVRALHERLADAPPGTIRFIAGVSQGRYQFLQAMLFIAAVFFVGIPLVLLLVIRDWHILGLMAGGAAFVWPMWRVVTRNHPRDYDPRHPPGELVE